jgi:hypothetical protein
MRGMFHGRARRHDASRRWHRRNDWERCRLPGEEFTLFAPKPPLMLEAWERQ